MKTANRRHTSVSNNRAHAEIDDYLKRKPGSTLKEFHDAFVSAGGLPIPLVRKILFREP